MKKYKIFLIAGEQSGDNLGAKLMHALKNNHSEIEFHGIGGELMQQQGLTSLFPMKEISLMGFIEIIPHIPKLLKLIKLTVSTIKQLKPDMVITIDSPGFSFRVAKQLKNHAKLVHYVAPSVWAYKEKRAKKIAKIYDHLLCLLPFEPPYFEKEGLASSFIGHPIIEDIKIYNKAEFRQKYNIDPNNKVLCVMPGSRESEIDRLLPIFSDTIKLLHQKITNLSVIIISTSEMAEKILNMMGENNLKVIITTSVESKNLALATADFALIKSGTSSLEVALAKVPMVVAYKVNKLSAFIIKLFLKIPYVSLVNIIEQKMIIKEFLQDDCQAPLLAEALIELIENQDIRNQQLNSSYNVALKLGANQTTAPSEKAANVILSLLAS